MLVEEDKYLYLSDIKCENMDYEKIVRDLDLQSENLFGAASVNEGKKRMRLHQLTWEEKIQRKKLRNRIAAQTSRDRKKAKMDHLEESVKELKQQNDLLFMEVQELKKRNEMLMDKNIELEKVLAERSYTCSCMKKAREEERKDIAERPHVVEEQICVEDGFSFERPAESCEIPQQKGYWPISAQTLTKASSWGILNIFLLYLLSQKCCQISRGTNSSMTLKDWHQVCWKKLNNMREEEAQNLYSKRCVHVVSGIGRQKCPTDFTMVGEASEKLESSRSEINTSSSNQQKSFWPTELSTQEKVWFISSEHSYSAPGKSNSIQSSTLTSHTCPPESIPTVVISESDKISAIENELKNDIEPHLLNTENNCLDVATTFPNFCSPRSEVSSDLGYESPGSPYDSEFFKMNDFDDLNDLWGNSFDEIFPELM